MSNVATKNKVLVSRAEYSRLKKLDQRFKDFWMYLENLIDIREARREIKKGKVIAQEELFRKLGF